MRALPNLSILIFALVLVASVVGCGGSNSYRTQSQSSRKALKTNVPADPLDDFSVDQPVAVPTVAPTPSVTVSPSPIASTEPENSVDSEDSSTTTTPGVQVFSELGKGGTSYDKVDEACGKAEARASEGAIAQCDAVGGTVESTSSTECDCYHKAGFPASYKICRVTTEVSCSVE